MTKTNEDQFEDFVHQLHTLGYLDQDELSEFVGIPDLAQDQTEKPPQTGIYTVTIDYRKPLAAMIAEGQYDVSNPYLTSNYFPITDTGNVTIDLALVFLNRKVSTREIQTFFEDHGLRPATLPELLALGAKYPDLQRELPLVAMGSRWLTPNGLRLVPVLDVNGSSRVPSLYVDDGAWLAACRFVVTRR